MNEAIKELHQILDTWNTCPHNNTKEMSSSVTVVLESLFARLEDVLVSLEDRD